MRHFLQIAALAAFLLFMLLCAGFEMANDAAKEGVKFQEDRVNEVFEATTFAQ